MNTIYALEGQVRFLFEKRTEAYERYDEGASEKKIAYGVKSTWQDQALPELERCGA